MCLIVPPEVDVTPTSYAIEEGKTALALTCNADGDEPLNVTWSKDGQLFNT